VVVVLERAKAFHRAGMLLGLRATIASNSSLRLVVARVGQEPQGKAGCASDRIPLSNEEKQECYRSAQLGNFNQNDTVRDHGL
jgi:hypothetical protein